MPDKNEFKKYATDHMGLSSSMVDRYVQDVEGMTPSVIEERPKHFREINVFSRLMMDRIIFLGTGVNDEVSNVICAQLLFLASVDTRKEITMYINSPGGSVYAGLAIYDTMQYISPPVGTVCVGLAASMGAVLLAGGHKKKRGALPHSRIMIHQPLGGTKGQASEIGIYYKQMMEIKKDLYKILADHTGNPVEKIEKDGDRDYWMRAEEAVSYGLIDRVLTKN